MCLGDHVHVKHGFAFQGEHFDDRGKYIVLTPGNFIETGGFKPKSGTEKYFTAVPPPEYVLKRGDLVIAMTEQSQGLLGSSAIIPADGTYLHNQRIGLVEPTSDETDPLFLYYLFNTRQVRDQIQATATGSKVRHTAPSRIYGVEVALPRLPIQQKITAILSAYDNLIENNERRIKILEEMAHRIYREWFVAFRHLGHEDPPLLNSELGLLPEGWTAMPLSDLATVTMGQSPPSSAYNRDHRGLPFHQGVGTYGAYFPHHDVYSTVGSRVADDGDILVSVRAPVGRINLADRRLILGRGLCGVNARAVPKGFLLHALREVFREEDLMGNGAIFKSVTKRDMGALKIVWPGTNAAERFSGIVEPMWSEIRRLTRSAATAQETRDLLLPRLISGEIDVAALDIREPGLAA